MNVIYGPWLKRRVNFSIQIPTSVPEKKRVYCLSKLGKSLVQQTVQVFPDHTHKSFPLSFHSPHCLSFKVDMVTHRLTPPISFLCNHTPIISKQLVLRTMNVFI